jgi:hypothetical protein
MFKKKKKKKKSSIAVSFYIFVIGYASACYSPDRTVIMHVGSTYTHCRSNIKRSTFFLFIEFRDKPVDTEGPAGQLTQYRFVSLYP